MHVRDVRLCLRRKLHANVFLVIVRNQFGCNESAETAISLVIDTRTTQRYGHLTLHGLQVYEWQCSLRGVAIQVTVRKLDVLAAGRVECGGLR